MRTEQEPTIEQSKGGVTETVERHPAYAQVGAHRVEGTAYLYGSDFVHRRYITITIARSDLHRGLSNDWPFGREELIEVALSEAQWATFVSAMNVGSGVQCTLQYLDRKMVPSITRPKPRTGQFKAELTQRFQRALTCLRDLRTRITDGKSGKKESLDLVQAAIQDLESNGGFVADQFGEHMEKVVEQGKVEVNAYAQHVITRLGLAALKDAGGQAPIALDQGE